jgi:hypothetical protein
VISLVINTVRYYGGVVSAAQITNITGLPNNMEYGAPCMTSFLASIESVPTCEIQQKRDSTLSSASIVSQVPKKRAARHFPCALCEKVVDRQSRLDRHMGLIHNTRAPERAAATASAKHFPCSLCGKVFGLQSYLDQHMGLTHNTWWAPERAASAAASAKQFQCSLCGKVFGLQWQLDQHMGLTHNTWWAPERAASAASAKHFPCSLCGKVFGLQSYLDQHIGFTANRLGLGPSCVAAEERAAAAAIQLPCALCGMVFHLQWHLNQHGLTHMGLIHNTRAPKSAASAAVIQKPTTDNEREESPSIEAEEHDIERIFEFVSHQAAQHYPAVKETVNEETVLRRALAIKCEPEE